MKATALALCLCLTSSALADVTHMPEGGSFHSRDGYVMTLPPGYYVDEPDWIKLDAEVKRLQEAEVRLEAERDSLLDSLHATPGWVGVAVGVVLGATVGAGAMWYLSK